MSSVPRVVLVVLDGFGERPETDGNAVRLARMPTFTKLYGTYPHVLIGASGNDVGLPDGQMGNSEVGHLNLGAGRIVYQDIVRIDKAIKDGSFYSNATLAATIDAAKASGGTLHLFGLTSPGNVHASLDHAYAVCEMAKRRGLSRVAWHAFLDGRDTPPKSAAGYLRDVGKRLARDRRRAAGVGGRPLLRDGPRQALGPGRGRVADVDARRWPARRRSGRRRRARLRQADRRIRHAAGEQEGRRRHQGRRRVFLLQLPLRPRAPADAGVPRQRRGLPALRSRAAAEARRVLDHDPLRREAGRAGGVSAPEPGDDPGRGAVEARRVAAAHRRDREVRARHLLLQRRRRAGVPW